MSNRRFVLSVFGLVAFLATSFFGLQRFQEWVQRRDRAIQDAVYGVEETKELEGYAMVLQARRDRLRRLGPGTKWRVRSALTRKEQRPSPWIGRRMAVGNWGAPSFGRPKAPAPALSLKGSILAAEALGAEARSLVPALVNASRDREPSLRGLVAFALARVAPEDPRALRTIETLCVDPEQDPMGAATFARVLIDPADREFMEAAHQAIRQTSRVDRWVHEWAPRLGGQAKALMPAFRARLDAMPLEQFSAVLFARIYAVDPDEVYARSKIDALKIALDRAKNGGDRESRKRLEERINLIGLFTDWEISEELRRSYQDLFQ